MYQKVRGFAGFNRAFGRRDREPNASRRTFAILAGLTILRAAAATAQAPAPPILNSPYVCANGLSFTVTTCKPYRADQWCETVEKQNGNVVTTMDSAWTQMTGRLAGCTNAGNAKPGTTAPSSAPSAATRASTTAQQSFNPPYLKEFPTVDQIMAQIKGANAQDTANRQLSALHELGQLIGALSGPRLAQNQMTADETRILNSYFSAYSDFAKSAAHPQDSYLGQTDFTAYLFRTFPMPDIQQLWEASLKQAPGQQQPGVTPLPPSSDPTVLATRRCVELGGSMGQCMTSGIGAGLGALIGLDTGSMTAAMTGGNTARLVVFGTYNTAGGLHFNFGDGSVDIGNCGKMTQGGHSYSIQPSGSQYTIKVDNQPQQLVMTLGANGKMSGPAAQDITGQKLTGYEVTTNLKTGASTRTPVYGPDTEHCSIGTLSPGPAAAPDQGLVADLSGVLSMLSGAGSSSAASKQILLSPGPRLVGTYAGAGGLKIQFQDAGAVIDCAQAHVMAQYDVSNPSGVVAIAVKNGSAPFNLALQSNGSLTGTGTATVNGKLMTGLDSNSNAVLTPTSANCTVGTLTATK